MQEFSFLRDVLPNKNKDKLRIRGEIDEAYATELVRAISNDYEVDSVDKEEGLIITIRDASPLGVAKKIIEVTPGCFILSVNPDGFEIREIKCPPCREGDATPLDKNAFLLSNGKFVIVDSKNKIRVYACRVTPSKID